MIKANIDNLTEIDSKKFYIIKFIAIFCVIIVHVNNPVFEFGPINMIITNFLYALGNTGVIAFFITSGFFYKKTKEYKNVIYSLVYIFNSYIYSFCYY